jgi:CBS domain-containing protein
MPNTVRDLMTSNPKTIQPSTPIVEAAKLMKAEDVGSLPIVDGDRLTGMLTDRDIVIRLVADGKDPQSSTANEIASRDLVTVDPQQSLEEVMRLMSQHQLRRIPVCEEDGRLIGIVAQADIARAGVDAKTGQVVEQISR